MASWKPKTADPSGRQAPVWSKSFASTLRGSVEEDCLTDTQSNTQSDQSNDRIQPLDTICHSYYRHTPNQINQLQAALKREADKILDIKDILEKFKIK